LVAKPPAADIAGRRFTINFRRSDRIGNSEDCARRRIPPEWCDRGKLSEARDPRIPICGWLIEDFATSVLQEAKALLEELGA
jgi:hypothetical protein